MSDRPQRRYEIHLGFPSEPRISAYRPSDFGAAVEYAMAFARKCKGVRVQVDLVLSRSPVHVHSYALFVCEFPILTPSRQKEIQDLFGTGPY